MRVLFKFLPWLAAVAVPVFYLLYYTPYGMDTTDFGYFYAYAWRILQGQMPYRDFFYIKPALPLYWHAFWMWLTPEQWQILAGKAAFCCSLFLSSWLGALYLARFFNFKRLGLSLPVLATASFVFSIHSFPHMPWHTADGVLFCAIALYGASRGMPLVSGIATGAAMLCKQSFAPVPLFIFPLFWLIESRGAAFRFLAALALAIGFWMIWICFNGAWSDFRAMTTGQLDIREALEAGVLIYLRQNWWLPLLACLPLALGCLTGHPKKSWLAPAWWYLAFLAIWYIWQVHQQKVWLGFGFSWPTLFMLLGGVAVLMPRLFIQPWLGERRRPLAAALILAAPLAAAWCVAISGGYKIPAFFAVPLLFAMFLLHARFFGGNCRLQWAALAAGLVMFWYGYQYPYVFPVRSLQRAELLHDAGQVYAKASGVKVDANMLARLRELRELRHKYGPNYKTLPGFSFAYYLNGDKPVIASDWLIDWEINGKVDKLYKELLDKNVTVFMERDQLDTEKADNYDRAGYGVPQMVRHNWKIVENTPHFVVFQRGY